MEAAALPATLSSWGPPSARIALSTPTPLNGPPKPATCLTLWVSWKTPKLDCGFCEPALASHVCSTACVATLLSHKKQPCACSTAWFVVASGISPGCTPTLCNGNKLLWGWAMEAQAFVPLRTTPLLPFWRPGHPPSRLGLRLMRPSAPMRLSLARKLLRPLLASTRNSSLKLTSLWTMFSLASSTPCPSGWTMLAGRNNSDMLALLGAQPCFQKPPEEVGLSSPLYQRAAPAWNLQPLFPNFGHDCRSLMLTRMLGARFVTELWTSTTTMRGCVWLVASALNATMLSVTLSVLGHTGLASGRNGNDPACCFPKILRMVTVLAGALPAFAGSPSALDFAITAPQRQETLAQASQKPLAAAAAYARHKEAHLQTAEACRAQGVCFVPMVAESTGAWDEGAMAVLKHVAQAVAAQSGEDPATCFSLLLQELGVAIRSFRARAALRRCSEGVAR